MNWLINTTSDVKYVIVMSENLFLYSNSDLYSHTSSESNRRLVVVDKNVNALHGDKIRSYFDYYKLDVQFVILDGNERKKNKDSLFSLLYEIEQFGILRRNEPIIGIGGGVVLDVVGLAASIYRRGVSYIRIPTTTLSIVDVSVAAKTGINYEGRRNRLGSYYPPSIVLLDKSFILTQNSTEISSGLGEILKLAVIKDYSLFAMLEEYGEILINTKFAHVIANEVIEKSIFDMKTELENNLFEKDLKRCVDFGHSFSPIIEMRSLTGDIPLTHGQAVTVDIIFSCIISNMRGWLKNEDLDRVISIAKKMLLPIYHPYFSDVSLLVESLNDTIKHRGGSQNLPIPTKIGEYVFINDLTFNEICDAAKRIEQLS